MPGRRRGYKCHKHLHMYTCPISPPPPLMHAPVSISLPLCAGVPRQACRRCCAPDAEAACCPGRAQAPGLSAGHSQALAPAAAGQEMDTRTGSRTSCSCVVGAELASELDLYTRPRLLSNRSLDTPRLRACGYTQNTGRRLKTGVAQKVDLQGGRSRRKLCCRVCAGCRLLPKKGLKSSSATLRSRIAVKRARRTGTRET